MTAPVVMVEGDAADLAEVMATMESAFDPLFGEAWTHAQCLGILAMPGVWLTLARDGGPVGFALTRVIADEAELLLLAVHGDRRRQGIGRALLDRTRAIAAARGAARLFLEVRNGNPARSLYDRAGFREVGCRRGYYRGRDGRPYDAHTLTLALKPS